MADNNNEGSANTYAFLLRNPGVTLNERNFTVFTHRQAVAHPWHDLEIELLLPNFQIGKKEVLLETKGTYIGARLQLTTTKKGSIWIDQVSSMLMDTYKGHGL